MYLLQGLRDKIETIVSEEHLVSDEKGRRAEQAALGGGIGRLLERARKVRRVAVAERCGVDSGALENREYAFARGERGDRKSTLLNSSTYCATSMPDSASKKNQPYRNKTTCNDCTHKQMSNP